MAANDEVIRIGVDIVEAQRQLKRLKKDIESGAKEVERIRFEPKAGVSPAVLQRNIQALRQFASQIGLVLSKVNQSLVFRAKFLPPSRAEIDALIRSQRQVQSTTGQAGLLNVGSLNTRQLNQLGQTITNIIARTKRAEEEAGRSILALLRRKRQEEEQTARTTLELLRRQSREYEQQASIVSALNNRQQRDLSRRASAINAINQRDIRAREQDARERTAIITRTERAREQESRDIQESRRERARSRIFPSLQTGQIPTSLRGPEAIAALKEAGISLRSLDDATRRAILSNRTLGQAFSVSASTSEIFSRNIKGAFRRVVEYGGAAGIVFGVINAFKQTVTTSIDLEQAFVRLIRVSGGSEDNLQRLKAGAFDLARAFNISVTEITASLEVAAAQFSNVTDSIEVVRTAAALSKLTNEDLSSSIDDVISVLQQFGISAAESGKIADKFAAVNRASSVSIKELKDAVSLGGAAVVNAGFSIDEFIGIIGALGSATNKSGKEITNNLLRVIERTGAPENIRRLEDLGINLRKAVTLDSGEIVGGTELVKLRDVLVTVSSEWDKYNATQKRNIASAFAGARAQGAFVSLMDQLKRAQNLATISANSQGEAQKQLSRLLNTTREAINSLKVDFQEFGVGVGRVILPVIRFFVDILGAVFRTLKDVDTGVLKVTASLVGMIGAIKIISSAQGFLGLGTLLGALATNPVLTGIATLAGALTILSVAIDKLTNQSNKLRSFEDTATSAFNNLSKINFGRGISQQRLTELEGLFNVDVTDILKGRQVDLTGANIKKVQDAAIKAFKSANRNQVGEKLKDITPKQQAENFARNFKTEIDKIFPAKGTITPKPGDAEKTAKTFLGFDLKTAVDAIKKTVSTIDKEIAAQQESRINLDLTFGTILGPKSFADYVKQVDEARQKATNEAQKFIDSKPEAEIESKIKLAIEGPKGILDAISEIEKDEGVDAKVKSVINGVKSKLSEAFKFDTTTGLESARKTIEELDKVQESGSVDAVKELKRLVGEVTDAEIVRATILQKVADATKLVNQNTRESLKGFADLAAEQLKINNLSAISLSSFDANTLSIQALEKALNEYSNTANSANEISRQVVSNLEEEIDRRKRLKDVFSTTGSVLKGLPKFFAERATRSRELQFQRGELTGKLEEAQLDLQQAALQGDANQVIRINNSMDDLRDKIQEVNKELENTADGFSFIGQIIDDIGQKSIENLVDQLTNLGQNLTSGALFGGGGIDLGFLTQDPGVLTDQQAKIKDAYIQGGESAAIATARKLEAESDNIGSKIGKFAADALIGAGIGGLITQAQGREGIGGGIGGALGAGLGGLTGPLAPLLVPLGGIFGGLLGSLFDKPIEVKPNRKEERLLEDLNDNLRSIDRNTRPINDLAEELINAPARFIFPVPRGIRESSITQGSFTNPFNMPFFQEGGRMNRTGPAFLHAGETVLKAGESPVSIGAISFNISGGDPKAIALEVKDMLESTFSRDRLRSGSFIRKTV